MADSSRFVLSTGSISESASFKPDWPFPCLNIAKRMLQTSRKPGPSRLAFGGGSSSNLPIIVGTPAKDAASSAATYRWDDAHDGKKQLASIREYAALYPKAMQCTAIDCPWALQAGVTCNPDRLSLEQDRFVVLRTVQDM